MHKVLNYGSALQAYALQKKITDLGYECEIIDYIYPNVEHQLYANPNGIPEKKQTLKTSLIPLVLYLKNVLKGKIKANRYKKHLFETFYSDNYILSDKTYHTRLVLENEPPEYDIYLTGSDQVWNAKYIGYDTSFMLHFAKNRSPKISYAASFSSKHIPNNYLSIYSKELSKYCHLSVREATGIDIIKNLTGKNAELVCDPTLLLTKSNWESFVSKSRFNHKGKYLLVYILDYAYDPYPYIYDRIKELNSELNLPIVLLSGHKKDVLKNARDANWAGPYEFIDLFFNASFVITTSFHGTCFALNFNIPLCAVARDLSDYDSRIYSLLKRVGKESSIIVYNEKISDVASFINRATYRNCDKLDEFRRDSINYLKTSLG